MEEAAQYKDVPLGTLLSAVSRKQITAIQLPSFKRRKFFTKEMLDAWTVSTWGGRRVAGKTKDDETN